MDSVCSPALARIASADLHLRSGAPLGQYIRHGEKHLLQVNMNQQQETGSILQLPRAFNVDSILFKKGTYRLREGAVLIATARPKTGVPKTLP